MFTSGGWWRMAWQAKIIVQNGGRGKDYCTKWWKGMSEAQKPDWKSCPSSLMAEMKLNLHCGCLGC